MRSNELKAGDFLFTHSHDFLGEAIDDAQGGAGLCDGENPSHVAQVVEDIGGNLWVYEMTAPRACKTVLADWLAGRGSRVWVAPMKVALTDGQKRRLYTAWEKRVGRWYDFLQIPVLWVWLGLRRFGAWVLGSTGFQPVADTGWKPVLPELPEPPKINGVCSQNVKECTEEAFGIQLPNWMQDPADLFAVYLVGECQLVEED